MDSAQIEQELEDLEGRLERLRSLYDQYFMGLEKLEPTVLRKDVDRKFWGLRREQVRNTALRFKFQMLIQRYNTYQQYWTRVVREIETGTYRRDIIKVAQRFGEKDALTILGKKRAQQYRRLAANQIDRRNKRKAALGEAEDATSGIDSITVVEEEASMSLSSADLERLDETDDGTGYEVDDGEDLVKDDRADLAATGRASAGEDESAPPPRAMPPVAEDDEPDFESLLQFATVGVKTWGQAPKVPVPSAPAEPVTAAPSAAREPEASPSPAEERVSPAPSEPPRAGKTKPPATPAGATGKSRVAELAAQMRAKKETQKSKSDQLDLDQLFDAAVGKPGAASVPLPKKEPAAPIESATASPPPAIASPPKREPAAAPAAKALPGASSSRLPTTERSTTSSPQPKSTPTATATSQPETRPAPAATSSSKPSPASAPQTEKSAPAAPAAARDGTLSDQKMREIYAKYVGAKRAANESTAGITFDKLASSLRAQAEKIRTTHPTRSIDFEIVTKDGKTALRPVVK